MQQLECVQGTFGSGKSTRLLERALAESSFSKRVLVVAPTENHLRDLKNAAAKMVPSLHLADLHQIVWQTAPALAYDATIVNNMDVVLIDDADYPIGYKWSMSDVVKKIFTSRRPLLFLTCRHAKTLSASLSIAIPAVQTLTNSYRLGRHTEFIKALFTPKAKQLGRRLTEEQLPILVPKNTMAEMVLAALNAVSSLYTVILCEDEEILQALFKMAPGWNETRRKECKSIIPAMRLPTNTNQYFDPCSLQLSTIANFFGRERRHVVAIFPDHQLPLNLFIEALTRHTASLTIVFSAAQPPAQLQNILWMTSVSADYDIFIDSAPKRLCAQETHTISDLAKEIVDDTRNLEDALDRVCTLFGIAVTCTASNLGGISYVGPPLPPNIHRALGSVVEAVVLAALGAQRLVESEVYKKVLATNPSWLSNILDEEEKMWRLVEATAGLYGQSDVWLSEDFHDTIRQTKYCYFQTIHTLIATAKQFANVSQLKSQVPLTLVSLQGRQYRGNADAMGREDAFGNFIIEIKHSLTHVQVTDYAIVQAALYAVAAGAPRACALNAASGSVVDIVLQKADKSS